jgi:hypothetical protein
MEEGEGEEVRASVPCEVGAVEADRGRTEPAPRPREERARDEGRPPARREEDDFPPPRPAGDRPSLFISGRAAVGRSVGLG